MRRLIVIAVVILLATEANAELRVDQGSKGDVVSLSGLYDTPEGCQSFEASGIVAKRDFAKDGLTLSGIILEDEKGGRNFMNISVEVDKLSMAMRANLLRGLQLLSRVGRHVHVRAFACGAAGRAFFIDAIK